MPGRDILEPGNVAVVTGAALGIGRAMSIRFAEAGLSVVMADRPGDDLDAALAAARRHTSNSGDTIIAIPADVANPGEIAALYDRTRSHFGRTNILVNNAVTRIGRGFAVGIAEWRHAMEVNLWGPVEAVNAFLPGMLASHEPGVIINVGSKQGITNPPGHPIYNMTKSALKTYTEALEHELRSNSENHDPETGEARVTAHLLVPGWTTTSKNAPKPGAWAPDQVVDTMIEAIAAGDFYIICPDGETTPDADKKRILWAAADITENRPPLSRWHPDYVERAKQACS